MIPQVSFWRRLYRIIRAHVNHYRYRPKKVKPIPIKVKSKKWVAPERVYIQPPRHHLDSLQEARRLEIKAKSKSKAERMAEIYVEKMPSASRLSDVLANDILRYQREASRAIVNRNDPHNYYHRER